MLKYLTLFINIYTHYVYTFNTYVYTYMKCFLYLCNRKIKERENMMRYQRTKMSVNCNGRTYYNVRIFRNFETNRFAVITGESYCERKPQMHAFYSQDGKEIDMRLWFHTKKGAEKYAEKAKTFLKTKLYGTKKEEPNGNRAHTGCQVYTFRH